jgi:serine/threonine protein kinase
MIDRKFRIEEFEILRSLGTGTVGEIFLAKEIATGRTIALKILQAAVSQNALIRSRFEREIMILERFRHPHIVEVYGGGETNGQLFFAMEYVDSGTVKELLQRYRRLPWMEVASIAKQICSALQFAHNHGIIHRDLKPGNLFLTHEGQVKLGDFGIARDMKSDSLTDQGMTVGTYAYMSPEQIKADARISGKADLYSLGCVLYEMLVGHALFQGDNFAELFEQHLRREAPRVSETVHNLPPAMDDIVAQLLKKNPDERPFNARIVQGIMRKILDETAQAPHLKASDNQFGSRDVSADQAYDPGQQQLVFRLIEAEKNSEDKRKSRGLIALLLILAAITVWLVVKGS